MNSVPDAFETVGAEFEARVTAGDEIILTPKFKFWTGFDISASGS